MLMGLTTPHIIPMRKKHTETEVGWVWTGRLYSNIQIPVEIVVWDSIKVRVEIRMDVEC